MAGYRRGGAGRIHGEHVVHVCVVVAVGCGGGKPLSHGCLVSEGWQEEKCCAPPPMEKKHTRSPHIHSPHVDLIAQQLLEWRLPARSARLTQLAADRPTRPAVLLPKLHELPKTAVLGQYLLVWGGYHVTGSFQLRGLAYEAHTW
jgi:hypothetical protein